MEHLTEKANNSNDIWQSTHFIADFALKDVLTIPALLEGAPLLEAALWYNTAILDLEWKYKPHPLHIFPNWVSTSYYRTPLRF